MRKLPGVIAFVVLVPLLRAQVPIGPDPLAQRVTDRLRFAPSLQFMTPTRHAPLLRARGIGTWTAPRFMLIEDGQPLPHMPLNFDAPDVAALDVLVIDSLRLLDRPALVNGSPVFGGALLVSRKQIPDSFVVAARAFAGSETGDPGIHLYTRENLPLSNRQKIGISASAVISNRTDRLAYRFSGASFGHFATGYAETDPLIFGYRPELGRDQSTNRFLRGEASLTLGGGGTIEGELVLHGVRGWDMVPFIPTFVHLDILGSSASVRARSASGNVDVLVRGDHRRVVLEEQYLSARGEFEQQEYRVAGGWHLHPSPFTVLSLLGDLAWHAASTPLPPTAGSPQVLSEGFEGWSGHMSVRIRTEMEDMTWVASAGVERSLRAQSAVSASGGLAYRLGEGQQIELSIASIASAPRLFELFGRYETRRERSALGRADTFVIAGNRSLHHERVESIDLGYSGGGKEFRSSVGLFLQRARDPIGVATEAVIRSGWPGDVVWSGTYRHHAQQAGYGLKTEHSAQIARSLRAAAGYQYLQNRDLPDVPMHTLAGVLTLDLSPGMMLEAGFSGSGRTVWKQFRVSPEDDDAKGDGMDGVLSERWLVDVSVTQRIANVWFIRYIDVRLELQNILDRKYRQLPFGAELSMTALMFVSVGL